MLIMVALIVMALLVFVAFSRYCNSLSGRLYNLVQMTPAYHAVVFHVYRLKSDGTLPLRGRLVARDVIESAKMYNCPVCIPIGEASEQDKSDSVINADYLRKHGGANLNIILGDNMSARTTYEEVMEATRLAQAKGWTKILAVGELPHLPRIVKYWRQTKPNLTIHYWGTHVPWYYYLFEIIMIPAEILLPVESKRRSWALNLAHRGPKKK
ncbi:MAG: hypothetical protein UT67_C0006G0012 [Candidatus Magasanikbacteria bacterium GW2011_GWA2_40_10]|uniref:DUF218 domain-containing protein n=1 Tax=Candidatus Magasanikbacteria bacterium GW2011_GWA2_40_10 TaxID=1619037 RepID=A0A0G0Q3Y0_9BACT|nr:MAG: hypothetical protein UT67_C0006G0012 [Candidatus Magasanikbacteria bacterium GW2011_GWA2_40_10]